MPRAAHHLVIVRLDRLARNVAFLSNLIESGVEFVAAGMPAVNRLTVHNRKRGIAARLPARAVDVDVVD